jgi:iron complex outermembrane receptor protein
VLNVAGAVIAQSIAGQAEHSWSAVTPHAVVNYQFDPGLMAYLSYSTGFKSGGYDNRATRLDLAELPFNPEHVATYETGAKGEFLNRRLRANLAVFYNDYKDLQVSFYDPIYVGTRRGNAGQAHSYGVELEADAKPVDRVSLFANAGYLYGVYDHYAGAGGPGVNADGHPLVNAPRYTGSIGGTWDLPIKLPGDWSLESDAQYQGSIFSSALTRPQDKTPSQIFLNALATWTAPGGHWSLSLSAKNLLNTQKPVGVGYTPSVGIDYDVIPDPRTILGTVRFQL